MDPLEIKIRELFQAIPYADSNVLDSDIVESIEVIRKQAKLTLIIPDSQAKLRRTTCDAIEKALLSIDDEVDKVSISVNPSSSLAEQSRNKEEEVPQHHQAPKKSSLLKNYKYIIAIASGKGGVGKSTVAVNLALALKKIGKTVSLFDADVYGPSIPMMMGKREVRPEVIGSQVLPISNFGIEFLSIGSIVGEEDSLIWRGPMVHQAVEQMLRDTSWPGGDYFIIDMPPGTGDVQITMSQATELTGAIVVCTPQDVAMLDAKKAIAMFSKVDIPLLGMIENMSTFTCDSCGKVHELFGEGSIPKECEKLEIPFLGKLPITLDVRVGGDSGKPVVQENPEANSTESFVKIARTLDQLLEDAFDEVET